MGKKGRHGHTWRPNQRKLDKGQKPIQRWRTEKEESRRGMGCKQKIDSHLEDES